MLATRLAPPPVSSPPVGRPGPPPSSPTRGVLVVVATVLAVAVLIGVAIAAAMALRDVPGRGPQQDPSPVVTSVDRQVHAEP